MADCDSAAMTVEIKAGELLVIGDVSVELIHKSGKAARLRVVAPRDTGIKKDSGVRAKRD